MSTKLVNIILWVVQLLLAVLLIWAASAKLAMPASELEAMWPWTAENPALVKITGVIDLVAGIGLVLPTWLRIQPKLTVYSAYGVIALMIAAIVFHLSRGEGSSIGFNSLVVLLAAFIAWGRTKKVPVIQK